MAKKRISMKKAMEILRLSLGQGKSLRDVGRGVHCSPSKVHDVLTRFKAAGMSWPLPEEMDESALEEVLYVRQNGGQQSKAMPDWGDVHQELRRKGVTLYLLWQEYKQSHPDDGYQYSQYCTSYRKYKNKLDVSMRQNHKAGDKVFVDWSGDGIDIVDRQTGEVKGAPLFVGVLGASGYTYAKAAESRESRHWIGCHIGMYEYFDGVPAATVPDNEKTGVTHPCLYEPELNPTYRELARHYNTAVIPTRPRKPKDKAKVENGVLLVQRWILAALRNHTFFSVAQANAAIAEKLEEYNTRPYQRLKVSRRELYQKLDRPVLQPLPTARYEHGSWSKAKVHIDYHVLVDEHYYSVPYHLVHSQTEVRRTRTTVEIFIKGRRVAVHRRSYQKWKATTLPEHMPESHRKQLEWTPTRIINWARKIGPKTAHVAEQIMSSRRHPELGFRSCLGIMRLGKSYGNERLENASARALCIGAPSYKSIKSILQSGLDQQSLLPGIDQKEKKTPEHDNIRGSQYYQ